MANIYILNLIIYKNMAKLFNFLKDINLFVFDA